MNPTEGGLQYMLDKIDSEIAALQEKKKKLEEAVQTIAEIARWSKVVDAPEPVQKLRSKAMVNTVRKVRAVNTHSWEDIRNVLKQFYPEMLTVTEISQLSGIPRNIVSCQTSTYRRLLRREYVKSGKGLHWMYKMTLRNAPAGSEVASPGSAGDPA